MIALPEPARTALFLDFDGTLVEIAARPQDVVVDRLLPKTLAALEKLLGGAAAIVSGRTIKDIDGFLAPLHMKCAGVHGAEQRFETGGAPVLGEDGIIEPSTVARLQQAVSAFAGVTIENKGFACAVHYRANPSVRSDLEAAMEVFIAQEAGLTILPGHCIFEIKGQRHTKATAIEAFMSRKPFAGRLPIFIGDDVTDSFGFRSVQGAGGLAYSVGRAMTDVDGWFSTPGDVRIWLEGIVSKASVR